MLTALGCALPPLFQLPFAVPVELDDRWEMEVLPPEIQYAGTRGPAGICTPGDLDGDGSPDHVTVADVSGYIGPADWEVQAISGADLHLLWTAALPAVPYFALDVDVEAIGDVDGDGIRDVIIGSPESSARTPTLGSLMHGIAILYSGATGAVIRMHQGRDHRELLGAAVSGIEDIDGDGVPDYLIGATQYNQFPVTAVSGIGWVGAYSGATGLEIYRIRGGMTTSRLEFGAAIEVITDVDGDGIADFLVGAPGQPTQQWAYAGGGRVSLHTGATGIELSRWYGSSPQAGIGATLTSIDDRDGDGIPEFVTLRRDTTTSDGAILAYSVRQPAPILEVAGVFSTSYFFARVRSVPDVDGDRFADLLVSEPEAALHGGSGNGAVRLHSGRDGLHLASFTEPSWSSLQAQQCGSGYVDPATGRGALLIPMNVAGAGTRYVRWTAIEDLSATPSQVSVSAPPSGVALAIDLPDSEAGLPYVMLLSTQPAGQVQFLGLEVPLGPSPLLQQVMLGAFPPLVGGLGTLDGHGDATAYLLPPPVLSPGLVGRSIHACAVSRAALNGSMRTGVAEVRFIP